MLGQIFELFEYIFPNISNEYLIQLILMNKILFEDSNISLQVSNSHILNKFNMLNIKYQHMNQFSIKSMDIILRLWICLNFSVTLYLITFLQINIFEEKNYILSTTCVLFKNIQIIEKLQILRKNLRFKIFALGGCNCLSPTFFIHLAWPYL